MRKHWSYYFKNTILYLIFLSLTGITLSILPSIKTSHIWFFRWLQENYYFRENYHTGCFSTFKFSLWMAAILSGFAFVNLSTMHNSRGGWFKTHQGYKDFKKFVPFSIFVYFLGPVLFLSDLHDNDADCHLSTFSEQIRE